MSRRITEDSDFLKKNNETPVVNQEKTVTTSLLRHFLKYYHSNEEIKKFEKDNGFPILGQ